MKKNICLHLYTFIHMIMILIYFYIDINYPELINAVPINVMTMLIMLYVIIFLVMYYKQILLSIDWYKRNKKGTKLDE